MHNLPRFKDRLVASGFPELKETEITLSYRHLKDLAFLKYANMWREDYTSRDGLTS